MSVPESLKVLKGLKQNGQALNLSARLADMKTKTGPSKPMELAEILLSWLVLLSF